MKLKVHLCGLLLMVLCGVASHHAFALDESKDFKSNYEANQKLYFEKQYEKSLEGFLDLLNQNPDNPALEYNIGNAYFQLGQYGLARQFYEKAKLKIPRYDNLRQNYSLLLNELKLPEEKSIIKFLEQTFYFWQDWLNLYELKCITITLSLALCLMMVVKLKKSNHRLGIFNVFLILIYAYFLFGVIIKFKASRANIFAIVVQESADLKSNYLDQSDAIFILPEGTKVQIIGEQTFNQQQDWFRVQMADGQRGWTLKKNLGVI